MVLEHKTPPQGPQTDHLDCEAAVIAQIQVHLFASYLYQSMAVFCDCPERALQHFQRFFLRRSHPWAELAQQLMAVHTERGGRLILADIEKPEPSEWHGRLDGMECAFHLEKTVHQSLLELHQLVASQRDPHLGSFLQHHYLSPQAQVLKETGEHLSNLLQLEVQGMGVADYIFDRLTLGGVPQNR